jgi:arginase
MRDSLSYYEHAQPSSPVSLISYPTELGSDARGLAHGPQYLLDRGLHTMLGAIGADFYESTVPCAAPAPSRSAIKQLSKIAKTSDTTARLVEEAGRTSATALVLGGDHSVAIGSIAGASRAHRSLGVIWIDAHPDLNTHETSLTRNAHGMGAALALGHGHPSLLGERRAIAPQHFLFLGLKDFDQAEIDLLRQERIPAYTMLDMARRGLSPLFAAIDTLARQVEQVWVSFDMDSIDKHFAPGVAMQNTGGFTAREALALAQYIGKTCTVSGIDLVEMLPERDEQGKTAALALDLVARLLGNGYGGYQAYMDAYENAPERAMLGL